MLRRWLWACAFVATVLVAALSHDAVVWAQGYGGVGFPGGGGRGIGLLNSLYCQLSSACVLTGDNSGGVGTLRIRPSDEDTQLVLCEASNNASPEVCSSWQHYNVTTTSAGSFFGSNLNIDSAGALQNYNTSFGSGYVQTAASTTAGGVYMGVKYPGSAAATANFFLACTSTGAATATCTWGSGHTLTSDFRGPITNSGSTTCNSSNAGTVCILDDQVTQYSATATAYNLWSSAASQMVYVGFWDSTGIIKGANGYAGASNVDADLADKNFVSSVGKVIMFGRSDDVSATAVHREDRDNYSSTGVQLGGVYGDGSDFKNGVTPTALSGDVNDYAGCTLSWCRISGGAANRNITGIASGADGKIFNVCNIGTTNTLVLVDESASSTAANRFALDADITIPVERCQRLVYDGTSSRWRAQQ